MGKNIVVFSDGTGQEGGKGHNSNVYKLFNMVEERTDRQIAYYDAGIGTDWRRIAGSITGLGFSRNILDCYRFIFENFNADDQIFLFGFSRGAATVRSLSAFIELFGILPKSREDLIEQAFDIYKITDPDKQRDKRAVFFQNNRTMNTKVRFLGVWDTVAALGIPIKWASMVFDKFFPHRFHNFKLSNSVEYARQALSIDDERLTFHPVLWDPLPENQPKERMKQVWFCGVHSDVGGGYQEEELSNITLKWMIREATDKGLIIYEKSSAYQKLLASAPNVDGMMHNEQKNFPGKLFRRKQRSWDKIKHGEPLIHASVLKRKKNPDNLDMPAYKAWISDLMDKDKPWIEPWEDDKDSDQGMRRAA